ncbi:hypothetical protein [Marinitenerispora sediminis]|uniref:hypothetical protein n=1 Tax=Marinitenerispora sediminis TaxID=1931232 RepID=UPI000DF46EBB|nr:hypothetical protein [Marinitenerispora sediminis]RCV55877.1 hypothetical protein DEF28_04820 [Marinitenerispora sediminis]
MLVAILVLLVAAGGLPRDLGTRVVGAGLFGMAVTVALDWRTRRPDPPVEEVLAPLTRMAAGSLDAEAARAVAG